MRSSFEATGKWGLTAPGIQYGKEEQVMGFDLFGRGQQGAGRGRQAAGRCRRGAGQGIQGNGRGQGRGAKGVGRRACR